MSALRTAMDQKVNFSEVENVRRAVENLASDVQNKASFRDLEQYSNVTKAFFEDMNKEILLKANIKDLLALLDTKANVEDVNQTLGLVQKEVEKCVVEDELRKALNE